MRTLGYIFFGFLFLFLACQDADSVYMEMDSSMKISVLNMDGKHINKDCLAKKAREVLSKVDDGKIVPYRVRIWQDHPLVKEALSEVTVRIERENGKRNILFPVKDHGSRIILYDHDKYVLYGIEEEEIHFEECFMEK